MKKFVIFLFLIAVFCRVSATQFGDEEFLPDSLPNSNLIPMIQNNIKTTTYIQIREKFSPVVWLKKCCQEVKIDEPLEMNLVEFIQKEFPTTLKEILIDIRGTINPLKDVIKTKPGMTYSDDDFGKDFKIFEGFAVRLLAFYSDPTTTEIAKRVVCPICLDLHRNICRLGAHVNKDCTQEDCGINSNGSGGQSPTVPVPATVNSPVPDPPKAPKAAKTRWCRWPFFGPYSFSALKGFLKSAK